MTFERAIIDAHNSLHGQEPVCSLSQTTYKDWEGLVLESPLHGGGYVSDKYWFNFHQEVWEQVCGETNMADGRGPISSIVEEWFVLTSIPSEQSFINDCFVCLNEAPYQTLPKGTLHK